ncbi:MAG: hypothetical protein WDM79_13810 [Terricaulis sp.]
MRAYAVAAIAALGLAALSGTALGVWTDPDALLVFDAPASWPVTKERVDGFTYAVVGNASNECHIVAMPRPETAARTIAEVNHTAATPLAPETWVSVANAMPLFHDQAVLVSQSVETDGPWPIQRAEIQSPDGLFHSAIQLRPGVELWTHCKTYSGNDSAALYDNVIRSVGTPTDAALVTRAAEEAAAAAAAAAAPPPPPPPPERRRNN